MIGYIDYLLFRLRYWLKRGRGADPYELEIRRLYNERVGRKKIAHGEAYDVLSYQSNGKFDYELYKKIQTLGNKGKIERVFVAQENIAYLCRELEKIIPEIKFVLCHGTRNAAEQKFFQASLSKPATILGTEISDTASQFPMTIEWDFHEVKPEWRGAVDVIYSNSFDHSYDPQKLFTAWLSCLGVNGVMVLEWSRAHGLSPTILDPFNIGLDKLSAMLENFCADGKFKLLPLLTGLPSRTIEQTFVLVQRVR
ncbi:MAG: hypothetical protein K2P86_09175 [Xanthobacteraceae bacterium]|jgi:uncharacterized protein with HEPN domain|nr:hypothetical protein [Xanthobacteraceae bacterium]